MFKKPKLLPPIRTYEEDYIWEADLMFFTHPAIAKENDGYLYILAIIDTFTKMVMLKKLKNKSTKTITEDVNRLFQREKPKYLRVDMGGEFVSNMFVNMCKKNKVKLYIAMEPIKCAMVERFIRTFKRILVQKMEKEHTLRWSDFVGDCKNIYDNRTHSTIKMTPLEAERKENQKHILRANLKRYSETATMEYFKIYAIDRRLSKDRYYLKDLKGDKLLGAFYEDYLVHFTPSEDENYQIDPSFKDFNC